MWVVVVKFWHGSGHGPRGIQDNEMNIYQELVARISFHFLSRSPESAAAAIMPWK